MSRPPHPRHAARRPRLLVALAVASLAALGGGCAVGGAAEPTLAPEAAERSPPNVMVVMTDDQALDTMGAMPLTRRLIGGRGTSFDRAFVSFPVFTKSETGA